MRDLSFMGQQAQEAILGTPGQQGLPALGLELDRLVFVGRWPQSKAPDQVEQHFVRGFAAGATPAAAGLLVPGPGVVHHERRIRGRPQGTTADLVAIEMPPGAQNVEAALRGSQESASVHRRPLAPSSVSF